MTVAGTVAVPAIWVLVKWGLGVPDRYLPSPGAVVRAIVDIEPNILIHTFYTASRLIIGFAGGVFVGIGLALLMARSDLLSDGLMPVLQSMRAVPAAAAVPFFLLWFGFSETGRYLLVIASVSFNIAVAALQILNDVPEEYAAFFHSFGLRPGLMLQLYAIPRICERILPTLRFSLSLSIGAVIFSEVLGSQIGLGYLIQTSRSTFSLGALFLVAIVVGAMNATADSLLVALWNRIVFWKATS